MPLGQRQATSASNKQQPEATTSATKIDPIRSIANVLNYHKQDKKLGNSGLGVGSGGVGGDKENSSTEQQQQVARPEELRRQTRKESRGSGGKEANISAKEQLKKTVTSGHSEPDLSSKLSPPKPNPKGAGQSNRSRSEKDRHTGENSQAELSSQVDQGNSYLYAYNDFIASNRSSSQQKQQQQQPQSQVTLNNHNIGDKLKVARQKQQPQSLKNLGAKSKSQICLVCGKQVHLEAEQEGEEETTTTAANKKIPTTNKQQVNSALASSSSHQTKLHNLNPNKSTNQREFVLLRESGNICISGSGHLFSLPANDLKQENFQVDYDEDNEDDDEEDEYQDEEQQQEVVDVLLDSHQLEDEEDYLQDDTLNYILNQQQQQQQRQAHEHLTRQLRVNQQPLTDLTLPPGSYREENPNHLRQYLQIEESFNSFKARKRGLVSSSPAAGGQSNITLARPPGNIINTSGQIIEHYGHELLPAAPRFTQQQFLEQQQRHKSSSHLNLISNLTQNLKQQLNLNTRRHKLAKRFSFGAAHSDHLTQLGNNSSATSNNTSNMYAQQLAGLVGDDRRGANPLAHGDQLTGQPGAYYMTDTNPSDHHQHNHHHLAHQPQHHLHHLHYPGQHSAAGATATGAASYPMVSSDSSLGSSGQAFAGNGGQSALRRMTSAWFGGGGAGAGSNSSSGIITNTSVVGHKASRLCCLCSKKCLFISCLMIILFIFILVISLSAYLNFLINSSRTNLLPLSGRFRYVRDDSAGGQTAQNQQLQLFNNRTSSEFLTKQTQFETILRGAFDRTQSMLKSFPNHLVKLEVYSFKPVVPQTSNVANLLASPVVWVYFRLFVNKKSLAQDPQLMKRKSPDESFDKLFLPRLTQQTLHSGFESLMATFGAGSSASPDQLVAGETLSNKRFGGSGGGSGGGGGASGASTGPKPARSSRAAGQSSADGHLANNANNKLQQPVTGMQSQQQVANAKSFDDQISRLMPLIESIDLQSIQVSQEFDMQQTGASFMANNNGNNNLPLQSTIMSDNLRASQPINRPASSLDSSASTEVNSNLNEPTTTQVPTNNGGRQKSQRVQQQQQQQETTTIGNVDKSLSSESPTRKFTLSGYRDNSTRPTTSSTTTTTTTSTVKPASTFLVNQQQRKPTGATVQQTQQVKPSTQSRSSGNNSSSSNTLKEIAQATSRFPPVPTTDPKVVRLVSGQPVVSQCGQQLTLTSTSRPPAAPATSGSINGAGQSTRVFGPLSKLDQDGNSNNNNQKVSSDTTTLVVSGNNNNNNPTGKSIEELWQDALNAGANQRLRVANSTASVMQQSQVSRANNERSSKPITVATITNNQVGQQASTSQAASTAAPSEWQKVSLLSADVSNTIRAQLNASLNNNTSSPGQVTMSSPTTTTTTTTTTTSTPATTSTQKSPKVSPHLRTAGSIISTSTGANQRQASPGSLNEQPSAVILSRDTPSLSSSSSSQQQAKPANSRGQSEPKKLKNSSSSQRSNSTSGADSTTSVRQPSKPKQQKLKKANNNNNNSRQSNSNSQNIRLVDEFLANSNNTTTAATLPTATIELTRSTTALPPRSTTPILVLSLPVIDTSEPEQPVRLSSGDQTSNRAAASDFVPANQLARPGTTSFSGQWRPLSNNSASSNNDQDFWVVTTNNQSNRTSQQQPAKPNKSSLALIIGTERLPANLNHVPSASTAGSQSPFAMSPSLLEQPARNPQQQRQRFTNSFRSPTGNARQPSLGGNNDFESHRVSRMRSSVRESARHHEDSSPMVTFSDIERGSSSSTSSSSFASSASTSTSTTTTTSSSLINSDARIVDDFMITPADRLNEPRGSTLLPPLVLSGFQQDDQGSRIRGAPVVDQLQLIEAPIQRQVDVQPPKKTRGPFAFETLRSVPSPLSDPFAPATGSDSGDPNGPAHSGRAERSPSGPQSSLIRKRLYVGNDDLSVSSTSSSRSGENGDAEESADGSTGHSGDSDNDIVGLRGQQGESRLFGNRRVVMSGDAGGHQLASKCQYFGCRAATTGEFTCLNNTQICDDFIDCRDESDELDCVSLLKHDQVSGSTGNSSKLSFSNGAGIVYLNRRGSLAPMCIDYFGPLDGVRSSSSSSSGLQEQSADLIKRQHELIRQINTIGQYACSLQSFSRLVSVKINHHDLVDGLNLIRSSKLFHRLSIQGGNSSSGDNANSESSFRSGHSSDYEVDLSTSSECPSQRTVFVKCGHFECGQDSFSVGSATSSAGGQVDSITTAAAAPKHLKNGLIINDFPWLVKLYWFDELACHGYLIDESWLITSSECFVNKTDLPLINNDGQSGWTAEISYEHYGNDDYQSIESNRRNVKQILIQQQQQQRTSDEGIESVGETIKSSIVLAKLEKPVRFSPLNRPICLPTTTRTTTTTTTVTANNPNKSLGNTDLEFDKTFKDCVSVSLPTGNTNDGNSSVWSSSSASASAPSPTQQQQDLILNKVKLLKAQDCLATTTTTTTQSSQNLPPSFNKNFICVDEEDGQDNDDDDDERQHNPNESIKDGLVLTSSQGNNINNNNNGYNLAKVEDQDEYQRESRRVHSGISKKPNNRIVAGAANDEIDGVGGQGGEEQEGAEPQRDHRRFDSRANQQATRVLICSINQASRSRSRWTVVGVQVKTPIGFKGANLGKRDTHRRLFSTVSSQIDWIVDTMNPKTGLVDSTNPSAQPPESYMSQGGNELNPMLAAGETKQQLQTCNKFKCSSGECLSWSRICDGLYDCSSHDDEKDCHK